MSINTHINTLRHLTANETKLLTANGNTASSWDNIMVDVMFDANKIHHCHLEGNIIIGKLNSNTLTACDRTFSVGLYNSHIKNCSIGDNVCINNVSHIENYTIGSKTTIDNVGDIINTNIATPVFIELMNENGNRKVRAFNGMTASDAYLWIKNTHNEAVNNKLMQLCENEPSRKGIIEDDCVICGTRSVKNCFIGSNSIIINATTLSNVEITSYPDEPTIIGDGVILKNGYINSGCNINNNSIADKFVMGENCKLNYGARLIDTFLGDNSTVECCEVRNSLIFNAHEQHHNNSFLIAACLMGQSNVAAGATLGSNHNSRAADGEILALRGFWPGLCTSVKHSSRFASFTLLSKADYPNEMNIKMPFCLVTYNSSRQQLEVTPAYWWRYNMFALARNDIKFKQRDKRLHITQHIDYGILTPDVIEEIKEACCYLNKLLNSNNTANDNLQTFECEKSKNPTLIRHPKEAVEAYKEMMLQYAIDTLSQKENTDIAALLNKKNITQWTNLGGHITDNDTLDEILHKIKEGKIHNWNDLHTYYLNETLHNKKEIHAAHILKELYQNDDITEIKTLTEIISHYKELQDKILAKTIASRKKDYDNDFRSSTFDSHEEMVSVMGDINKSSFLDELNIKCEQNKKRAIALLEYNKHKNNNL